MEKSLFDLSDVPDLRAKSDNLECQPYEAQSEAILKSRSLILYWICHQMRRPLTSL